MVSAAVSSETVFQCCHNVRIISLVLFEVGMPKFVNSCILGHGASRTLP